MTLAKHFKDLRVYQSGFESAMRILEVSTIAPRGTLFVDRSNSPLVAFSVREHCRGVAQTAIRRQFRAQVKLSDSDGEAAETEVWLDFALACGYIDQQTHDELFQNYENIEGGLVKMMADPEPWCGPSAFREEPELYRTEND
jgi:four helix bundle protein